jgi:hypothetical protein
MVISTLLQKQNVTRVLILHCPLKLLLRYCSGKAEENQDDDDDDDDVGYIVVNLVSLMRKL